MKNIERGLVEGDVTPVAGPPVEGVPASMDGSVGLAPGADSDRRPRDEGESGPMTVVVRDRATVRHDIHVKCPCGRDLRARPEQAGGRITCWDCRATVGVPVPVAPGGWVARLLRMSAKQILNARTFTLLAIGAMLVTLALSVTALDVLALTEVHAAWDPGIWAAALALGLVMIGYGELLRRGSQGDWTPRPPVGPMARAWRALICLGAGVALVMPLLIASVERTPPRLTGPGLGVALGLTLVMPLVMLGTYAPRGPILDRVRLVGAMIRRHPMAVLASLLVLPLSLPAIETVAFLLTRAAGLFSFILLDLFPRREFIQSYFGVPHFAFSEVQLKWVDFRDANDVLVLGAYGDSLIHGYTLLGAIPASLAMPTSNRYAYHVIDLTPRSYLAYRMLFTLVIVTGMLAVLAVQARWLGLLMTLDTRRSAARTEPG